MKGETMIGKAHVYKRNHINTDEIIPARYLNMDAEQDLAKHAMEDIDITFIRRVRNGDLIVAGDDFGCGSSREHAVWALRGCGVSAVIASGFARIFFRNCINNGFFAIECPDAVKKAESGDKLEVNIDSGCIYNHNKKEEYKFVPFPGFAKEIRDAGGLLQYIKKKGKI